MWQIVHASCWKLSKISNTAIGPEFNGTEYTAFGATLWAYLMTKSLSDYTNINKVNS